MTSGHGLGARSGHFLLNSRYACCFPRVLGKPHVFSSKPPSSKPLHTLRNLRGAGTPLISKYFFQSSRFSKWFMLKVSLKTIGSNYSLETLFRKNYYTEKNKRMVVLGKGLSFRAESSVAWLTLL